MIYAGFFVEADGATRFVVFMFLWPVAYFVLSFVFAMAAPFVVLLTSAGFGLIGFLQKVLPRHRTKA